MRSNCSSDDKSFSLEDSFASDVAVVAAAVVDCDVAVEFIVVVDCDVVDSVWFTSIPLSMLKELGEEGSC